MERKRAALAIEDGTYELGWSFGAAGERSGELVFNTSMTGYQEVLTDPSYKGQLVVMTYPHVGNYGLTEEDMESVRPFLEGFLVHEAARSHSNWQARLGLREYLAREGVVGIEGLDTRRLAVHLRSRGALRAVVSTELLDRRALVAKAKEAPSMKGAALARAVSTERRYAWGPERAAFHVVAVDYGIKRGMLRGVEDSGGRCTVVPADTSAADILALSPDGILLSNGPGDPEPLDREVETVKRLLDTGLPMFGICLGHQLLGLALGAKSFKLKFGHRGANHPVREEGSGRTWVTTHNHGFAIEDGSLPRGARALFRSLNDGTLEGLELTDRPVFGAQFHPEGCAGPHDARSLFGRFKDAILDRRRDRRDA